MSLLDQNGMNEAEFLAQYEPGNYPRPSVTADIVILGAEGKEVETHAALLEQGFAGSSEESSELLAQLEVLLIRRKNHPFLGKWALPGGFAEPGETLDQTALRELEEETSVVGVPLGQLRTFSTPGRDPRGWTITGAYLALVNKDAVRVKAGDDAAEAAWFKVEDALEGDTLAFDHNEIITAALQRLGLL